VRAYPGRRPVRAMQAALQILLGVGGVGAVWNQIAHALTRGGEASLRSDDQGDALLAARRLLTGAGVTYMFINALMDLLTDLPNRP
jgi:hypothetical protein